MIYIQIRCQEEFYLIEKIMAQLYLITLSAHKLLCEQLCTCSTTLIIKAST